MDLNEVAVFIQVVQTGSFTLAAKQLGMPKSTVSSKVSSLEKRLGVTLIQRTTRKLNVTPAGQAYFKTCLLGLEEIRSAEVQLAALKGEPQGLLRVTAPVELGSSVLPGLVTAYTRKFPKVRLEILLSDRRVDLLSESVDLAIRAGDLKDSTLIAKKLGEVWFGAFATPGYFKRIAPPSHPRDLRQHECLHFTPMGFEDWKLHGPKGRLDVAVSGRVIINDLNMVKALCLAGNGIALLPSFFVSAELKSGRLLRTLPEWRTGTAPVHFVYPAQKFVTPKLSAFIDLATGPLRASLLPSE